MTCSSEAKFDAVWMKVVEVTVVGATMVNVDNVVTYVVENCMMSTHNDRGDYCAGVDTSRHTIGHEDLCSEKTPSFNDKGDHAGTCTGTDAMSKL